MDDKQFKRILSYILTFSGLEESDKLQLQVLARINEILAYCNRSDIPTEMELPLAEVIASGFTSVNASLGIEGDITSYKEGDMSISFGSASTINGATVEYGGKLEGFKLVQGAKCSDKTDARYCDR